MPKSRGPVYNAGPDINRRNHNQAIAVLTETLTDGFRDEMHGVDRADPGAIVAVAVKLLNRLEVMQSPGRK